MTMLDQQIAHVGRLVRWASGGAVLTLRRRNTLRSGTGAPLSALAVKGAALAGATAITFDAPGLAGRLAGGSRWTLAGHPGPYTTLEDATVVAGEVAVTFSPALTSGVADNASVTISQGWGDYTVHAARAAVEAGTEGAAEESGRTYLIAAEGLEVVPESGDLLIEDDAQTAVKVETLGSAGAAGYRLRVKA